MTGKAWPFPPQFVPPPRTHATLPGAVSVTADHANRPTCASAGRTRGFRKALSSTRTNGPQQQVKARSTQESVPDAEQLAHPHDLELNETRKAPAGGHSSSGAGTPRERPGRCAHLLRGPHKTGCHRGSSVLSRASRPPLGSVLSPAAPCAAGAKNHTETLEKPSGVLRLSHDTEAMTGDPTEKRDRQNAPCTGRCRGQGRADPALAGLQ